jgi:hypothetical protein
MAISDRSSQSHSLSLLWRLSGSLARVDATEATVFFACALLPERHILTESLQREVTGIHWHPLRLFTNLNP